MASSYSASTQKKIVLQGLGRRAVAYRRKSYDFEKVAKGDGCAQRPVGDGSCLGSFPQLGLHLWSQSMISRIASTIGKPLTIFQPTTSKSRLAYTRVCIEVNPHKKMPSFVCGLNRAMVAWKNRWLRMGAHGVL